MKPKVFFVLSHPVTLKAQGFLLTLLSQLLFCSWGLVLWLLFFINITGNFHHPPHLNITKGPIVDPSTCFKCTLSSRIQPSLDWQIPNPDPDSEFVANED